ncbi:MAG: peptide-methionine (R)-S-oxide reductase MsrB [Acidobacteria bacterium]|nr:peptide-methionine (R)-S-oxide reductase MsrB [Acidobacteriota bacterium]
MDRRSFITSALALGAFAALDARAADKGRAAVGRVVKTDEEWRKLLTPEQFEVARRGGTEAPGSSPLLEEHRRGTFQCVCCDLPVFSSKAKYDSHTGWPSFWQPVSKRHVREKEDRSLPSEVRTEVLCARCDAHLGHVFDDGPEPTGLRYCMNGVALKFVPGKG